MNETELKREVVQYLRDHGWRVYVTSERRVTRMPVGWPDLFARHVGKRFSVWIETKAPGEKLSPEQIAFRDETLANGEHHWTVDSMIGLKARVQQLERAA